ncbi:hypothetical protein MCEMSEM18_03617 [Comamonadaceae bacterium]
MYTGEGEDVFKEAKERSLTDYLEAALGVTAYKSGSQVRMDACPNPACGHSAAGSGKVRLKGDRTWHCYSCNQFGSIIDAAMWLTPGCGTPLLAAKDIVYGNTPPAVSPQEKQRQIEADQRKIEWQVWVNQRIYEATRQKFEPAVWEYLLKTRGLNPEVVTQGWKRGIFGTMPPNREQATLWLKSVVGDTELHYAGLWKEDSPSPWIAGRPLVQFVDSQQYAEFRVLFKPTNNKTKKSLAVGRPGVPYFWKGEDPEKCLVTEACLEMCAARSLGYTGSIIGMAGTGSWRTSWFKGLAAQGVRTFELAFNNDHRVDEDGEIKNPGQQNQLLLARELQALGLHCSDASPKEVGDINDVLLRRKGIQ